MATIVFDLSGFSFLADALKKIKDPEYLLRPICLGEMDLMKKRIHIDGKNANETPIGTYNKSYLALRQRKYNRTADKNIIVSLTSRVEADWTVTPTLKGYGIGFHNVFSLQKMRWVEEIKGTPGKPMPIASLSPSEYQYAEDLLTELVNKAFLK